MRNWAYRQERGDDYARWQQRVLDRTNQCNIRLSAPFTAHVLVSMANRIAWFVWNRCEHRPSKYSLLDPAERTALARENGIRSGESRRQGTPQQHDRKPWIKLGISESTWRRNHRWDNNRDKRQPNLRAWERIDIAKSSWYDRRRKALAGKIPPGWDSPWDYLGLTQAEWEQWYAPNDSPNTDDQPDTFDSELNRLAGPAETYASGTSFDDGAKQVPLFGRGSIPEEYLQQAADYAVKLVAATVMADRTAVPSSAELIGKRKLARLRREHTLMQRAAAFQARKVTTRNRKEFHRRAKKATTRWRREMRRYCKKSYESNLLDYLLDCEEERLARQRHTNVPTASLIDKPWSIPGYCPSDPVCRVRYAIMMRDVYKANLKTALFQFKRAQRRGEQPWVPLWEQLDGSGFYWGSSGNPLAA